MGALIDQREGIVISLLVWDIVPHLWRKLKLNTPKKVETNRLKTSRCTTSEAKRRSSRDVALRLLLVAM